MILYTYLFFILFPDLSGAKPLAQLIYEDLKGECQEISKDERKKLEAQVCVECTKQNSQAPPTKDFAEILDESFFLETAKIEKGKIKCKVDQLDFIARTPKVQERLIDSTCDKLRLIQAIKKELSEVIDLHRSYKRINDRSLRHIPQDQFDQNEKTIKTAEEGINILLGHLYINETNDVLLSDNTIKKFVYEKIESNELPDNVCKNLKKNLTQLAKSSAQDLEKNQKTLDRAVISKSLDNTLKEALWTSSSSTDLMARISEADQNLAKKVNCQMDARYGNGAELKTKMTTIGTFALGFGLGSFSRLGVILYAKKAKVALNIARSAFAAELVFATKVNYDSIKKACFADDLDFVSSGILRCDSFSDEDMKNQIFDESDRGNCALETSLGIFSRVMAGIGSWGLLPKKWKDKLTLSRANTTAKITELEKKLEKPESVTTESFSKVRPEKATHEFEKTVEYQKLPYQVKNVISSEPKPFQYAEDIAAAGGDAKKAFVVGGKNSDDVIEKMPALTGAKLDDLDRRAAGWRNTKTGENNRDAFKPPFDDDLTSRRSGEGFLRTGTTLRSQLLEDNKLVLGMGLDHQKLASPILKIMRQIEEAHINKTIDGLHSKIKDFPITLNGKSFKVDVTPMPGGGDLFSKASLSAGWRSTKIASTQGSIFNDSLFSNYAITIKDASGKILKTDGLTPHLIYRYGFYQGGEYRVDPLKIIEFFGLK